MIERGLIPSPEADPAAFDRAIDRHRDEGRRDPAKKRRGGIVLMGIGLGWMVMFSFSGETHTAVGFGGFLAILGLAVFVSSFVVTAGSEPLDRSRPQPISRAPAASNAPTDLP